MSPNLSYWSLLTLPLLFWAAYHYYHDRHRPEPYAFLIFTLVLGYLSGYLGIWLYETLAGFGLVRDALELADEVPGTVLLYALTVIGPVEEIAKLVPFLLLLIHASHFDDAFDGVVYASFIAMGFALHENQHYLLFLEGPAAVGRAIASPMVHILFASIWGYAYGYADTHGLRRLPATVLGVFVAVLLHGIYDFFSLYPTLWTHVVPPLIILALWLARLYLTRHDIGPPPPAARP